MSFSPLRVFVPISMALLSLGFFWYGFTYYTQGRFTNMSHLLLNSSVIVFMLGLVAEQIASMRLERGDKLFDLDNPEKYQETSQMGYQAAAPRDPDEIHAN